MRHSFRQDWLSTSAPAYAILLALLILLLAVGSEHIWMAVNASKKHSHACEDVLPNAERLACYDNEFHHASLPPKAPLTR